MMRSYRALSRWLLVGTTACCHENVSRESNKKIKNIVFNFYMKVIVAFKLNETH